MKNPRRTMGAGEKGVRSPDLISIACRLSPVTHVTKVQLRGQRSCKQFCLGALHVALPPCTDFLPTQSLFLNPPLHPKGNIPTLAPWSMNSIASSHLPSHIVLFQRSDYDSLPSYMHSSTRFSFSQTSQKGQKLLKEVA